MFNCIENLESHIYEVLPKHVFCELWNNFGGEYNGKSLQKNKADLKVENEWRLNYRNTGKIEIAHKKKNQIFSVILSQIFRVFNGTAKKIESKKTYTENLGLCDLEIY